jgi:nicotinate-nucleotide adenylyltransferase
MKKEQTIKVLQSRIQRVYANVFGRTPLQQRLDDILGEAEELHRYTDMANLREEAGDLLSSLLQLYNESGWQADDLITDNLQKILRRKDQYKSLGRKIKVALFGGAFDPIHQGHIAAANFVLNTTGIFDEAWVQPCFAHMYNKKMVSAKHRLAMCQLAVQGHGRIKVSDFEIKEKLKGETYHMIKRFLEVYKDKVDPSIVIGLDNANTFDKWVNYRDLERMVRFVVVARPGEKRDPKVNWYLKAPHIFIEDDNASLLELSSTKVKEYIKRYYASGDHSGEFVLTKALKQQINDNVFDYILKHELYK